MPGWVADGLGAHVTVDGRPRPRRDPYAYTERLCALHAVGSSDDCAERLRTSAERTGIRHVVLMVDGTGDRTRTLETIDRLGGEVLPLL